MLVFAKLYIEHFDNTPAGGWFGCAFFRKSVAISIGAFFLDYAPEVSDSRLRRGEPVAVSLNQNA